MADVIAKVAQSDGRAIENTARQIDPTALAGAVEALLAAHRIVIYGAGASMLVAGDFTQKLQRINRIAFGGVDFHSALTSAALLENKDAAVVISHSGTTRDTVEILRAAKVSGACTIAVTNRPRSPLAELADYLLTTSSHETTFRSGAMASRIAALSVIDMLFVLIAQRSSAGALEAVERTRLAFDRRRRGDEA